MVNKVPVGPFDIDRTVLLNLRTVSNVVYLYKLLRQGSNS